MAGETRKKKRSLWPFVGATAGLGWAFLRAGHRQSPAVRRRDLKDDRWADPKSDTHPQSGRQVGRAAEVPEQIPPRGWWDILKRAASEFSEHELMSEAAGITFYALLSLFPAITAMVSIYGLFSDPKTIESNLSAISGLVPGGGMDIIKDQVHRLVQSPSSGLTLGAAFGVLASIWSANQGSKAMLSSLNDVYDEKEGRGFVKLTAVSLAFTMGAIVVLLIGLGLIIVMPLVFKALGMAGVFSFVAKVLRWPVIVSVLAIALAVVYRYGPDRRRARWRWITWGSVFASVAWIVLSIGFSWYVTHFGSYNKTYGSLGAIIGFMTWIWLSSTVVLLGGQLNAAIERQTAVDTTVGGRQPIGERGAKAADQVGS